MKLHLRMVAAAFCFLGAAQAASALLFKGTITQTITDTNDPERYVGETFVGSYIYDSPTIDGTFYTTGGVPYGLPEPGKLKGTMWQPHFDGPWVAPDGTNYDGLGNQVGVPLNYTPFYDQVFLTIAGGVVTDFYFYLYHGDTEMRMDAAGFSTTPFIGSPYMYAITTGGTVVFSNPVEMHDPFILHPPHVPDASSTGYLVGFGAAGCFVLRRYRSGLTSASCPL